MGRHGDAGKKNSPHLPLRDLENIHGLLKIVGPIIAGSAVLSGRGKARKQLQSKNRHPHRHGALQRQWGATNIRLAKTNKIRMSLVTKKEPNCNISSGNAGTIYFLDV